MGKAIGKRTQKHLVTKEVTHSFTFPISQIEVEIPWRLNEQQIDALIALEEFRMNPRESQFTLSGYAGSGKTSIINIFHKYLIQKFRAPVYSAPTHRALSVISQMNPNAKTITLAKIFGLRPEFKIEDGDYSLEDLEYSQQVDPVISPGDFLIIDECSMVSQSLYEFIQKNISIHGLKVLYVGDSAQIKPVKEDNISRVFTNDNGRVLTLTKVERTGDNPILKEATDLRNGLDFSRISSINQDGHGVEYVTKQKVREIILNEFPNIGINPLHIRCLGGTNAIVKKSNEIIRQIMRCQKQIVVGEILMGYDNFGYNYLEETYQIINSGDYQVYAVTECIKTVDDEVYSGYEVRLYNATNKKDARSIFIVDNNEDEEKISRFVEKIKELNISAEQHRRAGNKGMMAACYRKANELKSSLAFMKDHYNNNGRVIQYKTLDYGYTHTIHKSQGGTYDKIIIVEESINAFRDESLKQQLKYVAMSRARKNVYIV